MRVNRLIEYSLPIVLIRGTEVHEGNKKGLGPWNQFTAEPMLPGPWSGALSLASTTLPPPRTRITPRKSPPPHRLGYEKDLHVPILSTGFLPAPCHSDLPLHGPAPALFDLGYLGRKGTPQMVDFLEVLCPQCSSPVGAFSRVQAVPRPTSREASIA